MEVIQSKQNPKIKAWKKLATTKGRQKAGQYLIEGTHLVEEALKSGQPVRHLVATPDYDLCQLPDQAISLPLVLVSPELLKDLSETPTPQGIMAIIDLPSSPLEWQPSGQRYLILDAIQDPGNLGTLIRTADAAAYDGVILGKGTVDVYNDKVLRASQGSLWHLEVVSLDLLQEARPAFEVAGIPWLVTALHQEAKAYQEVPANQKLALVLGNEGQGVSEAVIQAADQTIYIPMPGQAESLNVAVAGGILMFYFQA